MSLVTVIALASAAATAAPVGKFPGEIFPPFDIDQRCSFMAQSANSRIVDMSQVCREREKDYRTVAAAVWKNASERTRETCEIKASLALGSYEILSDCLTDGIALEAAE